MNETCYGFDVAPDWNAIRSYVLGGKSCAQCLDSFAAKETRMWIECTLTEKV